MPDTDHPQGSIAYSLPPLSGLLCNGVETVSGGHRHGTHSFLGVFAFAFISLLVSRFVFSVNGREVALGAGIFAVLLTAFAIKALRIRFGGRDSILNTFLGPWIISVTTAGLATWYLDYTWTWLPLAIAWGSLIHCLGDLLTEQGVPLLWPFNPPPPKALVKVPVLGVAVKYVWQPNGYFRIPILGMTDSFREEVFGAILSLHVIVVCGALVMQLFA